SIVGTDTLPPRTVLGISSSLSPQPMAEISRRATSAEATTSTRGHSTARSERDILDPSGSVLALAGILAHGDSFGNPNFRAVATGAEVLDDLLNHPTGPPGACGACGAWGRCGACGRRRVCGCPGDSMHCPATHTAALPRQGSAKQRTPGPEQVGSGSELES